MAEARFCYLAGEGQAAALVQVLDKSWAWLTGAGTEEPLRAIVERATAVDFVWLRAAAEITGWPGGRVFGAQGELSWRCEDGLTHVVLVSDRAGSPEPFTEPELPLATLAESAEAAWVALWGERKPGELVWEERRLPDLLHYPIADKAGGKQVRLQVRRYRAAGRADDGTVDFVRYVDVAWE